MFSNHRYPWGKLASGLLILGLLGWAIVPGASISSESRTARAAGASCFLRRNWSQAWRMTPDARTMYINVAGAIYRLDLAQAYPLLRSPWAVLHDTDSSDSICTAIDLRLSVTDRLGNWQALIVKRMTLLTPEEAAVLPKSLRP